MSTWLSGRLVPLSVFVLAVLLQGCATSGRLGGFDDLAEAGVAYADAIPALLDESFVATTTVDSLVLVQVRDTLEEDDRLKQLSVANASLRNRLDILGDLKRHVRLLRSYFLALQAIARTDAGASGLTTVTGDLVSRLGELHPRLAGAKVGGTSIENFVGPGVQFVFNNYRVRLLNAELTRNAVAIERELDLQKAALQALGEAMEADLEAQVTASERDLVVLPFVSGDALPSDWTERRLAALIQRQELQSVDAAVRAAENLRMTFIALVENRLDQGTVSALFQDIQEILALVEAL